MLGVATSSRRRVASGAAFICLATPNVLATQGGPGNLPNKVVFILDCSAGDGGAGSDVLHSDPHQDRNALVP